MSMTEEDIEDADTEDCPVTGRICVRRECSDDGCVLDRMMGERQLEREEEAVDVAVKRMAADTRAPTLGALFDRSLQHRMEKVEWDRAMVTAGSVLTWVQTLTTEQWAYLVHRAGARSDLSAQDIERLEYMRRISNITGPGGIPAPSNAEMLWHMTMHEIRSNHQGMHFNPDEVEVTLRTVNQGNSKGVLVDVKPREEPTSQIKSMRELDEAVGAALEKLLGATGAKVKQ